MTPRISKRVDTYMLVQIFAILGAVGIAVTIFMVILMYSERPVKAFLMAIVYTYVFVAIYLFVLKKLEKRKE